MFTSKSAAHDEKSLVPGTNTKIEPFYLSLQLAWVRQIRPRRKISKFNIGLISLCTDSRFLEGDCLLQSSVPYLNVA